MDYTQLLMIGRAEWWTQTPSTTPLQPKKMKCSFLDYVHFWWSAWLIDELEPHLPPLSYQKNEMLNFRLHSTSDDQPSWSIDSKSICQPSPANKMKCFFLDYVHFWWSARLVDGWTLQPTPSARLVDGHPIHLQPIKWNTHFLITFTFWWSAGLVNGLNPHLPALSSQKNEMLIFGLRSTSDDQLGWSMDSNPILHLSPAKEMKCSFLYYVQLLMIGWAGRLTRTPSTTPLQPKQWNAHFCITFNIWCWPDWSMDLNPIHHPSLAKKWNAHFWVMFIFWWLVRLFDELKPHLPPLSSQ